MSTKAEEILEGLLGLLIMIAGAWGIGAVDEFMNKEALPRISHGLSDLHTFTEKMTKVRHPTVLDDPETFKKYVEEN